jgi:hypothetical protein
VLVAPLMAPAILVEFFLMKRREAASPMPIILGVYDEFYLA